MSATGNKKNNIVKKSLLALLALIILSFIGFKIYTSFFQTKETAKSPSQTVVTSKVDQKDFSVLFETSGNIVANNIVDIRPQVTNLVSEILIKDGQDVKAGDILFTLDDRSDKANYAKAKAIADDAQRQYARAQELLKQNFVSQAAVDTTRANAESAQASADAAKVVLSFDTIRSPITGRAGVINVFPGSLVSSSNVVTTSTSATATTSVGAMVTISQLNPINVLFTVPEANLSNLMTEKSKPEGIAVTVNLANGDKKIGKVYVVDNQVDTAIGAVRVKARLDNSDFALIPGQFVKINLQSKLIKDALVIPSQAIISNTQGDQIYIVDAENKVSIQKIKILAQVRGFAAITGPNAGDRIVVEGKSNLRPGMSVVEAKAPEASK
ncbi:MAG: efflux RND transporter periplasmic adaptor subunit [Betaproteobacteria bacterium]